MVHPLSKETIVFPHRKLHLEFSGFQPLTVLFFRGYHDAHEIYNNAYTSDYTGNLVQGTLQSECVVRQLENAAPGHRGRGIRCLSRGSGLQGIGTDHQD